MSKTRSSRQLTHLLQTPDTFVRTPMPGLVKGMAIVHASPALGAEFLWMTVELEAGGSLAASSFNRFFYVLEGEGRLSGPGVEKGIVAGGYAYAPATVRLGLHAQTAMRCVAIDKRYEPLEGIEPLGFFSGNESELTPQALNGDEGIQVRAMMPPEFAVDFAVNTMTYAPGAALSQVEIHYMEHGLLMLEGSGPYWLGDSTYATETGDFIWMGAYCPQWFQADQSGPAKYLIYKNFNRLPPL